MQAEGPGALFGQGVAWLRRNRVLLPGITVLTRLVISVREQADDRLYRTVSGAAAAADADLPARLRVLLDVSPAQRVSEWERLRRVPVRTSGPALERALAWAAERR